VYSAAIPQRADMVLERCTNAVASPFGVTGALLEIFVVRLQNERSEKAEATRIPCANVTINRRDVQRQMLQSI